MNKSLIISVVSLAFVAGCGDKPSSPAGQTNAVAGSSPVTAPADYLGAAGRAQQLAVKTVDTTSINEGIQLFQVDKGRYPRDLNELVQEKFLPRIPATPAGTKLDYNPRTGEVKVVRQ